MEEILMQVGNVSFPIVVSIYLLVRVEGKLELLTKSIYDLAQVIGKSGQG